MGLKKTNKSSLKSNKEVLSWHLMLMPAVVFTFIFAYLPLFGIVMAFQKFNPIKGFFRSEFIGLENFRYVFLMPGFKEALTNTLTIASGKIVLAIIVPLIVALLINEIKKRWFTKTVQTLFFMPYFLSWVILGGVLIEVLSLSGPVNSVMASLGMEKVMFLLDNDWFPKVLIGSSVWKGMGYNMVIFLAAIIGIDQSLYEAAWVDGANRWDQCLKITIPCMLPIIILVSTLSLGGLLNAGFDQVLMLYNPIVYESGDIIDTFVYRLGMFDRQYSAAAAVGLFKSSVSLVLVSISYYSAYKFSDYRIF